jgi:hypothetical protein
VRKTRPAPQQQQCSQPGPLKPEEKKHQEQRKQNEKPPQ